MSPVIAAGVLVAHTISYQVTGTPTGPIHDYLHHAPQILIVVALLGLAVGGLGRRLSAPPTLAFPVAALAAFAIQEHVEHFAHTGQAPMLLASPVFLVGLALQLPIALLVWALARGLLDALGGHRLAPHAFSHVTLECVAPVVSIVPLFGPGVVSGRGPPSILPR